MTLAARRRPPPPPAEIPIPAPAAPARTPKRRFRSRLLGIWALLVYVWLFAPIFVMVLFSFNKQRGKFNITWNEFTLDNWAHPSARRSTPRRSSPACRSRCWRR